MSSICQYCGEVAEQRTHKCPRMPVTLELQTTHAVFLLLTELRDTGLFGETQEAVAEELLRRAIRTETVVGGE